MPSKSNRRQIVTVAMTEAFVKMLHEQGEFDDEYFLAVAHDLFKACDTAYPVLNKDPNGGLWGRYKQNAQAAIDKFKEIDSGRYGSPEHIISFLISIVGDQLNFTKKNERKKRVFKNILSCLENMLTYFDPEWAYDAHEGEKTYRIFDGLRF
jgi:hypothetical protein